MRALCIRLFVDNGLASLHTLIWQRSGDHTELTNIKQRSHTEMYAGSEILRPCKPWKHMQTEQEKIFGM